MLCSLKGVENMLQEQLELENACALTNTLEIKYFSWFQFHVFTFAIEP